MNREMEKYIESIKIEQLNGNGINASIVERIYKEKFKNHKLGNIYFKYDCKFQKHFESLEKLDKQKVFIQIIKLKDTENIYVCVLKKSLLNKLKIALTMLKDVF